MRNVMGALALALFFASAFGAVPPQQEKGLDWTWAFHETSKDLPPPEDTSVVKHLPGSTKSYTQAQIDDRFNPPDWFPDEHAPMPPVVQHGVGTVAPACALCHLASGLGHPESANLTGLSAEYLMRQLVDFKSGARKDAPVRMSDFAKALSDDEMRQASEWFASLKPSVWEKVMEADTVPKTYVNDGRMRFAQPGGGTEPLGQRIIIVPEDPKRVEARDPHAGFIAYVPIGSIAKGEALVTTGGAGKTIQCAICHGPTLTGLGDEPRIAGHDPIYIVRQLYNFRNGARTGGRAELMKAVVAQLNQDDMIAIAAYVASRNP